MKQVLITLGILLAVMVGFYWINNRYATKKAETRIVEIVDKQIYFKNNGTFLTGQESVVQLMVRDDQEKVASYRVDFNFDPAMVEIKDVEVNKDIFDKKAQVEIDGKMGKVKIVGENVKNRDKLVGGEIVLANLKIKSLKKGNTMIYSSRKAEIGILENGKIVASDLEMPNFKINIL